MPKILIILLFAVALIVFFVLGQVAGFFENIFYRPVDPAGVESVNVEVWNTGGEENPVTYSGTGEDGGKNALKIEEFAREHRGVNGLAAAVIWRVEIEYKMENGKIVSREYSGQDEIDALGQLILSILDVESS